uniref:Uncharacterized protein isoform X5 n=1 Tax=Pogona vitticeps TaxID=103695 RepID=A0ABM5FGP1_9SAUR
MEPQTASPEVAEEPERIKKCSGLASSEYPRAHPGWRVLRDVPQESCRGMQHRWEAQWQEFLETVPSPPAVWESPELTEMAPWEDAKAFLASFEQVAKACQWPQGEWVARLQPALSGEAKQAFNNLEARDREDYGKVKAAILREDAIKMEVQRQHFRQFRYEEIDEPRRIHSHLQELCHRWLRPERRSKEQILELLILEQFLASLPPDLQGWIRAGGPDTCSQAVALVEDFLMSQQEAEREKWQEPLPEMTKISPEAEKASMGVLQKQVQKEVKQNRSKDNGLLDSGNQDPRDPRSLLPHPDEPEIAEADLTEVSMNFREAEATRHMVELTPAPPGQQTMFWQVMQEEEGGAESLEGLLVPKPELASRPEEAEEEMFVPFPVASERLLGQDSGTEKRSWVKRETSQEEKTGALTGLSPWMVPSAMAEVQEQRCEKNSLIKMENAQQGEAMPALTEMNPWNLPLTTAFYEQRYEASQELERKCPGEDGGSGRFSESLTIAMGENSRTWDSRPRKFLVSKYGRKCNYRLGFVMKHPAEDHYGHPMSGENLQEKTYLVTPQRIQPGRKAHDGSECGKSFQPRSKLVRHQRTHTGESSYECLECGKNFISRATLMVHQIIHTGEKPFGCPQCGKCFNQRTNLLRHQRIHTGEKVHECPKCGKKFYRKDKLILHQRVHTGEKPYECLQCHKSFTAKEKLLRHQRIHLGY